MIPQRLSDKITDARPFLDALKKNVADTLGAFADSQNYPFSGRIKRADSVAEKIEMGRYQRFSEIDDLVAFTLIVPRVSRVAEVVDFCKASFDVVSVRSKSTTQKPPEVFRFDSTRVIARVRRPLDLVDAPGQMIFKLLFEIQVRTAFEHAWSVATHDLVYKAPRINWKRVRLAAQLKATSEGLDAAVGAFDELAASVEESPWDRMGDQIAVSEFVVSTFDERRLPEHLRPASVSRFSENFCTLARGIRPNHSVHRLLEVISDRIGNAEQIPMSLSLYQLFLGMLCQGIQITRIENVFCHVTMELAALFPETTALDLVFDYDT